MPRNTIEVNSKKLLIHFDSPTTEDAREAYGMIAAWQPETGATLRIEMNLSDLFYVAILRDIFSKTDTAVFKERGVLFEVLLFDATKNGLDHLFTPLKTGKKFPANLSFYCVDNTSSKIWIDVLCEVAKKQLFSECPSSK